MHTITPLTRRRIKARRSGRNGKKMNGHRPPALHQDQRAIIIAPVGRDASAMASLLASSGLGAFVCQTAEEGAREIRTGAGVLLLTQEVMELPQVALLFHVLQTQPAWSELPIIILTSGAQAHLSQSLDDAGIAAGTVTLLERPISTRTLVHSVEVALRSRRRQYQVRDLVVKLAKLNETLEERVADRTAEALKRTDQLRQMSAELSRAEERERRRIAQVLHDDLQQLLMAARMHISVLCKTPDAIDRNGIAQEIANLLERSFHLTRSLSVELAPPVLRESGLAAALEWLAVRTSNYYDVQVTAETDASANPQAADVRDFLFRAVRELLLNAVKHATGKPVHIAMDSLLGRQVRITVSDEGPGLNADVLDVKAIGANGFGLFNIRERILSFGGNFQIESPPGSGTRIILVAPCDFESS